jgi:hypothetical protein
MSSFKQSYKPTIRKTTGASAWVVLGVALFLAIVGFGAYYLQKWMKSRRTTPTEQFNDSPEVHHSAVIESDDPKSGDYLVPSGNYPVSQCTIHELVPHVKESYEKYRTLKTNKSFVSDLECDQGYYTFNVASPEEANRIAYEACQKEHPGRCGVVSTNDFIYAHQ